MTKREFLDTVFALAPNETNKIMDAFDEYVDSNEPPANNSEIPNSSDTISRAKAIEALETVEYDFSESELSEVELEEVCGAVGDVRQDMIGRIKQLPPAQPEIVTCDRCVATKRSECIWHNAGATYCSLGEVTE